MKIKKNVNNRFSGWRDSVITPAVEVALLATSFGSLMVFRQFVPMTWLEIGLVFYGFLCFWTVVAIRALMGFWPVAPGVYTNRRTPWRFFQWNLYGFLLNTNLSPFLIAHLLIPVIVKKFFYQMMGLKAAPGINAIFGSIPDPFMVSLGKGAMVGHDAIVRLLKGAGHPLFHKTNTAAWSNRFVMWSKQ